MSSINFKQTLDNSDFKKKLEESTKAILESGTKAAGQGKKIEDAFKNQGNSLKQLLDNAKSNVVEQTNIIKKIEDDISSLSGKLKKMSPSIAQQEIVKEVQYAKQALKEETAILNEKKEALDKVSKAYKEHSNETDRTANKLVTLRTQLRDVREELSRMEQDGLRGTEAYDKLQLKLGELTHQMNSTQKQARVLADEEKYLTATIQAISGIAGAFSVAQGAVGLFGDKNEELQKIMVKVQSLMAITIGLQQVSVVLNKNSAVSVLFLSKAQRALATSLGISTAAAKAFMIAITGGLVIGLMALISLYEKLKAKKEANKKATEELKEKEIEFYKSVGDAATKNLSSILILQEKYKDVRTLEEKNKFLKKHTETYEELGLAIKSVADQENLLVANTDAVVNSIIKKAVVEGYQKKLKEVADDYARINIEIAKENEKKGNIGNIKAVKAVGLDYAPLESTGANTYKTEMRRIVELINSTNKEIDQALKNAGITPISIEKTEEDKKQKDLKDISSYGKSIADMWQKIYQDIEQAKASSINNEFARTTELNTLNAKKELDELDKQIEAIKQKRIEQAKAEHINKTGSEKGFVAPIITLTDEEKRTYEERAKQIIDNVYKLNQEAYENLIGDYLTYEEKRKAIQEKYDEERKTLVKLGLTKNIEELNKIEQKELSELDNSFASKQESFLSWLDNIMNLTQKQLENQIKIAKKSIENGDLDEETLAILRVKIKELEARLKEKEEELKEVDAKDLGFSNVIEQLSDERKKLREELAKGEKADSELIKAYKDNILNLSNELYSRIDKVVGKIKLMSSFMKDFADATGEAGKGFSEIVGYAEDFLDKVMAGAKAGGVWGAIAGGVVSIATSIMRSIQQMKEEKKELEENELDYQRELNQLYRERAELIAQADNALFGRDMYQSLLNYMQLANQREAEFNSLLEKWQESFKSSSSRSQFNPNGGAIDSILEKFNLIKDGIFDIEKARALLSNGNLSDEVKRELEKIIDAYEGYVDALKEAEAITAEIIDQFRYELMDSLFDGWMRGADGALRYGEIAGKVLDDVLRKIIYTKFFSDIFDDLSDKIWEINRDTELSDEERISAWGEAILDFGDAFRGASQRAEQFWQTWVSNLQGMGFDTIGEANRNAQSQGIQSISQESADRIDGALTALLGSSYRIEGHTETIKDYIVMMLSEIQAIRVNTAKLDGIDYKINQIITNGIKVV